MESCQSHFCCALIAPPFPPLSPPFPPNPASSCRLVQRVMADDGLCCVASTHAVIWYYCRIAQHVMADGLCWCGKYARSHSVIQKKKQSIRVATVVLKQNDRKKGAQQYMRKKSEAIQCSKKKLLAYLIVWRFRHWPKTGFWDYHLRYYLTRWE